MTETINSKKQVAGIILSPVLFGWLGPQIAYWTGSIASDSTWSEIGMACGLLAGLFSIYQLQTIPKVARITLFIAYIPGAIIFMYIVRFFTSCLNGDCI